MRRLRLFALSCSFLVGLTLAPAVAAAGGPAPSDNCVPGTVWEDRASGVKYLCVYDEAYGGPRWVLMRTGQEGASGWLSRSSTNGCLLAFVGLSGYSGGGADAIARSFRWPCATSVDRTNQPIGELRSRVAIQRYASGGWSTCRDSGFQYNSAPATGWMASLDMGASADCGPGTYRALGYGSFFQGGAWRGASLLTPALALP